MTTDLQGMSVLVTRPLPQGLELCQQIEMHLGKAHYFPTITFTPAVDQAVFKAAWQQLRDQDWLIFVSPRAVSMSRAYLQATPFSSKTKFAAVGSGTARALQKLGLIVSYPTEGIGSEALLALEALQNVEDEKIAIIRGVGGRELLARTLRDRGAIVTEVEAYQRELPMVSPTHYVQLCREKKIAVVVCTSFEGVANFKRLMGEEAWFFIKDIALLVVSERVKKLAEQLGFTTVFVAKGASNQAIINSLVERYHDR